MISAREARGAYTKFAAETANLAITAAKMYVSSPETAKNDLLLCFLHKSRTKSQNYL